MKAYGIAIAEGANITNLAVATGTSFPSNPDEGELFFRTDTAPTTKGLYCYIGGSWDRIASADSLTAPIGSSLPGQANAGDLFYKNSNDGTEGLYAYNDSSWVAVSGATTSFTISGDVSGTIDGGTDALTLATVNSNVGSFGNASSTVSVTVNAKGLVTAVSAQQANIDGAQVVSGTFADARVAQSNVTQHQGALALAASQTTSGSFADARISQSSVTQYQGALSIAESQIPDGSLLARNAGNETITGSWTFNNPIVSADPSASSHLTTKQYVDSVIAGLSWKNPVRVATTGDITLSGTQTVDGAALVVGNRVLVKNQTTAADNGIYVVASGTWTRATDFDSISPIDEINSGAVFVTGGNTYADTAWTQILPVTTVGTDSMSFVQFSASGAFTAGSGLTLSGNTFNIGTVSTSRIVVNVDDIDLATVADGGGGSLLKFTRDNYGRVTGTSSVATGDLTGLIDGTYVNITGDTMSGALGIGATASAGTSLTVSRNITGATTAYAVLANGVIQTDVTSQAYYNRALFGTAPSTTIGTIAGFVASQGTIGAGSAVTNHYGFLVDSSMTGATNNVAFIGNLAAATGRWNFYGNGSAQNYFLGNVGIGAGRSVPTTALDVNGAVTAGTQTSTSGSTILRGFYNDGAITTFGTEYANGGPVIGYAVTPSLAAAGAFVSSTGINATRAALTFEGHTLVFRNAGASVVTLGSPVTLTERLRVTGAGDVGIGVTPQGRLHVLGASQIPLVLDTNAGTVPAIIQYRVNSSAGWEHGMDNAAGSYAYRFYYGTFGTGTPKVTLTSAGNLGIGLTAPTSNGTTYSNIEMRGTSGGGGLLYAGDSATKVRVGYSGAAGGGLVGTTVAEPLLFETNGSARMVIASNGQLGMGGNTNGVAGGLSHQLAINYPGGGSMYGIALKQGTNTTVAVNFVSNSDAVIGSISTTATTTSYATSSDSRLKKNVQPVQSFGAVIDAIEVVSFDWKVDDSHQRAGFIAQDLHEVVPEAVRAGDTDPNTITETWAVDPSKLIPLLVKEIQELRARVAALENA